MVGYFPSSCIYRFNPSSTDPLPFTVPSQRKFLVDTKREVNIYKPWGSCVIIRFIPPMKRTMFSVARMNGDATRGGKQTSGWLDHEILAGRNLNCKDWKMQRRFCTGIWTSQYQTIIVKIADCRKAWPVFILFNLLPYYILYLNKFKCGFSSPPFPDTHCLLYKGFRGEKLSLI